LCGPEDGKLFEIRGPVITIGRLAENGVCIPLELSISRHHARLVKTGDSYELEILTEARNAATVGGQIVVPGEKARLERGNIFKLGDVLFELGAGTECGKRHPNTNES
jgi:pSer/pThr/pTyr-binding forkhead associated (FHA) protein